jgi:hypothetical protein
MAIVVLIAAITWLGVAAERTRSNKSRFHTHFHANGIPHDPFGDFMVTATRVPFWPVYWRTVLGLPWDWNYRCVPGDGHRGLVCEHDFPQIYVHDEKGRPGKLDFLALQAIFDDRPLR